MFVRLSHITCKAAARRSCKISQHKTIRRTVPAMQPCSHCVTFSCRHTFHSILVAALRFSAQLSCGRRAAFVRQMRGWRTFTSVVKIPWVSCSSLAAALRVLQLSYVFQKMQTNRKENEHVENLVFDIAVALRPCFLYGSLEVLFTTP